MKLTIRRVFLYGFHLFAAVASYADAAFLEIQGWWSYTSLINSRL